MSGWLSRMCGHNGGSARRVRDLDLAAASGGRYSPNFPDSQVSAQNERQEKHFLTMKRMAGLLALTVLAVLIHGYHPYAEDAEIYLPGVLKILDPSLFRVNTEFFGQHAGHTLYPNLIAALVQLSHLPLPWVAFLVQIASIFLLLLGAWHLAAVLFEEERARWAAVALLATLLTLPVAGTALYIFDQYLNPRNLAAFAALFVVADVLHRRYVTAALWVGFAAAVHPLMASFVIVFCVLLVVLERYQPRPLGFAALLPFGLTLDPPPAAYHEVALRQPSFYILRWHWYEWLGLIGPLFLFWWLARLARQRGMRNLELIARAMIPFLLLSVAASLVFSVPRFEALARLQPLRCFALGYMMLIVAGGGLVGQHLLKDRAWLWPRNVPGAGTIISCQRAHRMAGSGAAQSLGPGL